MTFNEFYLAAWGAHYGNANHGEWEERKIINDLMNET